VTDLVFFYGTLMSGFERRGRARVDGPRYRQLRSFVWDANNW
jgi:hypothetical protein